MTFSIARAFPHYYNVKQALKYHACQPIIRVGSECQPIKNLEITPLWDWSVVTLLCERVYSRVVFYRRHYHEFACLHNGEASYFCRCRPSMFRYEKLFGLEALYYPINLILTQFVNIEMRWMLIMFEMDLYVCIYNEFSYGELEFCCVNVSQFKPSHSKCVHTCTYSNTREFWPGWKLSIITHRLYHSAEWWLKGRMPLCRSCHANWLQIDVFRREADTAVTQLFLR